jgi:anti-sigma regulatory factor (Ser/Thr protein kinase)
VTGGWLLGHAERHEAAADAHSIGHLRHQTVKTLADWGVTGCADQAELVVSELLTNALRYGRTPVLAVELSIADGWLRIAVDDLNPDPPHPSDGDLSQEDGRGMVLVSMLADAWGFRTHASGKTVSAEFDLTA